MVPTRKGRYPHQAVSKHLTGPMRNAAHLLIWVSSFCSLMWIARGVPVVPSAGAPARTNTVSTGHARGPSAFALAPAP